jgi:hypothetical protein
VNGWIVAVVAASAVTLILLGVFVAAEVSQILDLGRTAQRFQDEVGSLTAEIGREASTVSDRTSQLQGPGKGRTA